MPQRGRGGTGQGLTGGQYTGGSPGSVGTGAKRTGEGSTGWPVNPLSPLSSQAPLAQPRATGNARTGSTIRRLGTGQALTGAATTGGYLIFHGAYVFDFVTVADSVSAYAPRQEVAVRDTVLVTDSAVGFGVVPIYDTVLVTDSASTPVTMAFAHDTVLVFDSASAVHVFIFDQALVADLAEGSVSLAPVAGIAQVFIAPIGGNLIEGCALQAEVQFLAAELDAPVAQWVPVDPGSVTLTIRQGDGTVVNVTALRNGVGYYYAVLSTSGLPGSWMTKWVGSTPCSAVGVAGISVAPLPAFMEV